LIMKLFLIDTIAPFFSPLPENKEYNWSKIPFHLIEDKHGIDKLKAKIIFKNFKIYIQRIKQLGYNAVTLDELCRFTIFDFYPLSLQKKLKSYQFFYKKILDLLKNENLQIFINTDIMFYNNAIEQYLKKKKKNTVLSLLNNAVKKLFRNFPQVTGVIFRIGESDGVDVEGDFHSRLFIKTPKQCREMIRSLLPVFEEEEHLMIIRSWTLGAYPVGDLMWNRNTFRKVFAHLESEYLVVSHKAGESDFFRYLNLNPLFFLSGYQKLIELQCRREYEGFGEFPCYTGTDHERINRYLQTADNMLGVMVWAQTGGWSHFTRLTFLRNSSLWTELNIFATINIFKYGIKSEEAVLKYAARYFTIASGPVLLKLLRLSERIIRDLWYLPEFSVKRHYFRRLRIPTILWVYWDNIMINHILRKVVRRFVMERKEAVVDGYRALSKIYKLKKYAAVLKIDQRQFNHMYDIMNIIAHAREYFLGKWNPSVKEKIICLSREYSRKYPHGFHINYDFSVIRLKKWMIKIVFRLSLRAQPNYSFFDKYIIMKFSKIIYLFINRWQKNKIPSFLNEQAMGLQVLFK